MAKLALFEGEAPKRWVQFDMDTEFELSYLSKEEAHQLNKEVEKIVNKSGGDRMIIWNLKLGQRTFHRWRHITKTDHPGLTLPDGSPIPVSPENRDMLMRQSREVSLFVNENVIDPQVFLEIEEEQKEVEDRKNE